MEPSQQKNILIVDDEPALLLSIETGFEGQDRFKVITAANGREALGVLEDSEVDLVVTDLRMPEMDGFELLAEMSSHYSTIPNVVMSAFGTPKIEERLQTFNTFRLLNKPVDFDALEQCITAALDAIEEQEGSFSGLSLGHFLQLIEAEQKSCSLFIFGDNHHKGEIHFHCGRILDARLDELCREKALYAMLAWENVKISIHELVDPEMAVSIETDLMLLLMEGARLKDEADEASETKNLEESLLEEFDISDEQLSDGEQTPTELGGYMAGIKDVLIEMADEMDGVLAIQVTGMDGITIATHNPTGADVDAFSAKFAMIMKLLDRSVESINGMGDFDENLVQSQNAWILTRFLGGEFFMGIVVSRDGTLGNVRLVAGKYQERLRKSL